MATYIYWLYGSTLTHPGRADIPFGSSGSSVLPTVIPFTLTS